MGTNSPELHHIVKVKSKQYSMTTLADLHWALLDKVVSQITISQELQHNHDL